MWSRNSRDACLDSLEAFAALSPSGQGEIGGCMHTRPLSAPAQAETANVVAYLKDQDHILCSSLSSLPVSRSEIAGFPLACVGVGGNKDKGAVFSLAHVGVGGSKEYFVRSAGQDFVRSEKQNVVGVRGLQKPVRGLVGT